jgi:OPA family glycerol-3-phosphate transporter-like MFS transporter
MAAESPIPAEFRDAAYRHRRFRNWMIVGLLYSFFYMTRYNFSALAPTLQDIFGWTKADLGIFETLLPLVYGISVVVNAPIADRFGGRKSFLFGAAGVVVLNIAFGLFYLVVAAPAQVRVGPDGGRVVAAAARFVWNVSPRELAWIMAVVWGVNGYFQSFGALSIVKINAQWFHLRERGTFGAIFGVLIRFGLILAFSGVPLIVNWLPWQWGFFIPAGFVALLFVLNLLFVAETPVDAGFTEMETGDAEMGAPGERVGVLTILRKVFISRTMWMIAVASMMIGFVRRSVVDAWWPVYFKDVLGVSKVDAAYQVAAWGIALAGIAGGFASGMVSDRVYGGRRAPAVTFGFLGIVVALAVFAASGALRLGAGMAIASMLLLSFFVNGAHGMIGGAASMDFGGKKGAATAAGLFDGMQYLAGAVTGTAVGYITTNYGWEAWKLWPIPFALVGAVVMGRLWNVRPSRGGGH